MFRRFVDRSIGGELLWLGPHWREVLPLYRDLEKLEDLINAVGGAVWLQHDRRFSLLNSLEHVHHQHRVDLDSSSDMDQKKDGADAHDEQRRDLAEAEPPPPPEAPLPGAPSSSSAAALHTTQLKQQQQQKPRHRHRHQHYYFVDAGDDSIAADSVVQAIFDEVTIML